MKRPVIRYQAQKHEKGCALACLAMILGKTQEELDSSFLVDFKRKGITVKIIKEVLADNGLSVIEKEAKSFIERNKHNERMLEPFAHAHLVTVQPQVDAPNNHSVVMTRQGRILDPARKQIKSGKDYYYVVSTVGVFWD